MAMRVRERYRREPSALLDPASGAHIVPDPAQQYADDDPMVVRNSWYFIAEGETDEQPTESVRIQAPVEQATRAPGEKRTTRRRG